DVDAFVNRLEQPRERRGAIIHATDYSDRAPHPGSVACGAPTPGAASSQARCARLTGYFLAGCAVGGWVGNWPAHLRSFAARMAATDAPDEYICIASRATSMQMPHVIP